MWFVLAENTVTDIPFYAGFNMGNDLAKFVTYAAFLVDGNLITNRMSIGGKTRLTGPDPPSPAQGGGLNTHAVFEGALPWVYSHFMGVIYSCSLGDASMTRGTVSIFFLRISTCWQHFQPTHSSEIITVSTRPCSTKWVLNLASFMMDVPNVICSFAPSASVSELGNITWL